MDARLIIAAAEIAREAHAGQTRKYDNAPYITHPEAVAALVATVPHTEAMLAAAWLHDVVEDTAVTPVQLFEKLALVAGVERADAVVDLVGWLTEAPAVAGENRKARKEKYRAHLSDAPADAQTIKLADLIDNSRSIVERDPDFARVYLREKRALLEGMTDGDPELHARATAILKANLAKLGMNAA
jgi:(p)ppGpp synthase/HD superfamily hydrolase